MSLSLGEQIKEQRLTGVGHQLGKDLRDSILHEITSWLCRYEEVTVSRIASNYGLSRLTSSQLYRDARKELQRWITAGPKPKPSKLYKQIERRPLPQLGKELRGAVLQEIIAQMRRDKDMSPDLISSTYGVSHQTASSLRREARRYLQGEDAAIRDHQRNPFLSFSEGPEPEARKPALERIPRLGQELRKTIVLELVAVMRRGGEITRSYVSSTYGVGRVAASELRGEARRYLQGEVEVTLKNPKVPFLTVHDRS